MESLEQRLALARTASKTHIEGITGEIADEIINSKQDPFFVLATAARNAHFWSTLRDSLKPYAAQRIHSAVSVDEVKFLVSSSGKIDYSSDPTWNDLETRIQQLRAQQKEVEKVLQKQRADSSEIDPETGEIFEVGHANRSQQKKTLTIKF